MTAVLTLSEWDRKTIRIGDPTRADLDLISRLEARGDRKLDIRWLRDGRLEVRSTAWIGVVRLSGLTIQIRPKYAGDELGVLQLLQHAGGYGALKPVPVDRTLRTSGIDLLDLLCHLLAEEASSILRDGVIHDYTTEEETLRSLRGSLMLKEQMTRRYGQLDQLECRFDEFHADVIENQLLRTGIAAAARVCDDRGVRSALRRTENLLSEVSSTGPLDTGHYRSRISYSRRNERYRRAHELAYLLLDHLGVDDLYAAGDLESFAFLVDMNRVFESFVTALIDEAFKGTPWRVTPQRRVHSVVRDQLTGKRYSSIIPDVVLTDRRHAIPFDCKYKLYGSKKIASADVYQSFLYAYALAGDDVESARCGIIYPANETKTGPHLGVSKVDGPIAASLTGISVDLLGIQKTIGDRMAWPETLAAVRSVFQTVLSEGA